MSQLGDGFSSSFGIYTLLSQNYYFSMLFCAGLLREESGLSENENWRVYSEGLGVIIAFTEVLLSHEPRESHTLTCDSRLKLWKMQVEGRGYWSKNQSVQIGGLVILDKRQRQYEVQEIQIRTWGVL